jgi:hypothetical protein
MKIFRAVANASATQGFSQAQPSESLNDLVFIEMEQIIKYLLSMRKCDVGVRINLLAHISGLEQHVSCPEREQLQEIFWFLLFSF